MITEKTLNVYIKACNDKGFLSDIKKSDNDKKPGIFASDLQKALFAAIYYGYIVGKHGPEYSNKLINV
jgi:hypothetical protein